MLNPDSDHIHCLPIDEVWSFIHIKLDKELLRESFVHSLSLTLTKSYPIHYIVNRLIFVAVATTWLLPVTHTQITVAQFGAINEQMIETFFGYCQQHKGTVQKLDNSWDSL